MSRANLDPGGAQHFVCGRPYFESRHHVFSSPRQVDWPFYPIFLKATSGIWYYYHLVAQQNKVQGFSVSPAALLASWARFSLIGAAKLGLKAPSVHSRPSSAARHSKYIDDQSPSIAEIGRIFLEASNRIARCDNAKCGVIGGNSADRWGSALSPRRIVSDMEKYQVYEERGDQNAWYSTIPSACMRGK